MPQPAWIRATALLLALTGIATPLFAKEAAADPSDVSLHRLDETQFQALLAAARPAQDKLRRIDSYAEAKALLGDRARFDELPDLEAGMLVAIVLPNGRTLQIEEPPYFIAYYPEEDILLLRGGHESDQAYDLRTGEDVERTGNPEYIVTSPDGAYRLTGYFPGQQCSEYLLQRRASDRHARVLSINQLFDAANGTRWGLCTLFSTFWSDTRTLNFYRVNYQHDAETGAKEYFQLRIASP